MGWTTDELTAFLDARKIPKSSYSFKDHKDDAICLQKVGEEWVVYYSERGQVDELARCATEAKALNIMKLFLLESHRAM